MSEQPKLEVIDGELDKPLPEDEKNQPVTRLELRRFVRDEMIRQNKDIQRAFDQQEHRWIEHQSRNNLIWNGINAIVRVLYKKRFITNSDLERAGYELMHEAKQNMEALKIAQSTKTPYKQGSATPSPIDEVIDAAIKPTRGKTLNELRRAIDSYNNREMKEQDNDDVG